MATAGEGAAAAASSSAYEGGGGGGGAGGKFRKKPFRRGQATPYDRPPTALRNPSWLSKLVVDPASKLISAGAQRFFSSLFRKRLPPPPTSPAPLQPEFAGELNDEHLEAVPNNVARNHAGGLEPTGNKSGDAYCSDVSGISDLEQLLKQKTFTRSEVDRLTELLHSRALDVPSEDDFKQTETNILKPTRHLEAHQQNSSGLLEGNKSEAVKSDGILTTPFTGSRAPGEDVASPAELAKAYMGSRPSKISPSMLGMRSQAVREEVALLSNVPYTPKSPLMPLTTKTVGHVGVLENGFVTPRSRGRSAIYNMARTPYSRVHSTAIQKANGSMNDSSGYQKLFISQSVRAHDTQFCSKQTLKRRSSMLDDDFGSVGPIRRIRQKSNLLSHGVSRPTRMAEVGPNAVQQNVSSVQNPLMDESKRALSRGFGEETIPSTSYTRVPSKSSETAARILEHLEKMTPKEKSSDSKLPSKGKSPIKLTPNMLHGQALRSLEDVDSMNLLQNSQENQKLETWSPSSLPDSRDSSSYKKIEENGPMKSADYHNGLNAVTNSDNMVLVKGARTSIESFDTTTMKFAVQPSQKKRAFKMSAHEDSLELDDDVHPNGSMTTAFTGEKEKPLASVTGSRLFSTDESTVEKSFGSKTASGSILSHRTDGETSDAAAVVEKRNGVTLPPAYEPSDNLVSGFVAKSASGFEKTSKTNAESGSSTFPSSPVAAPSDKSLLSWTGTRPESSSSLSSPDARVRIPQLDKGDAKSSQEAGDARSVSPSSTVGAFSFSGAPVGDLKSTTGLFASGAASFSLASAPLVTSFSNANNSSSVTTATLFTLGVSAPSSSSLFASTMPSFSAATDLKFASSMVPSTTMSPASTASDKDISGLKVRTEKESSIGNLGTPSLSGTSLVVGSTGSSIFGLSASVTPSTSSSQSQGSLFSSGNGSLPTAQSIDASASSTPSQTFPTKFASSASLPVFGTNGLTSSTSSPISSTLNGSSVPTAKPFSSSSETTVGSNNFATPGAFSFGVSSASSSGTYAVSSSSIPPATVFSFTTGSSASSSVFNTVSSSSTASGNTFAFGASSSASSPVFNVGSSSSTPAANVFSFGAGSSASSTGTNAVSSSSAPTGSVFSFGASTTASSSGSSAVSSSSTPTASVYSFGAASASSSGTKVVSSSSTTTASIFNFGASSSVFSSGPSVVSSSSIATPSTSSFVGMSSASSSGTQSISSSSSFGSGWQVQKSPTFGSTVNASSSTAFTFGQSSPFGSTNATSMVFGSSTGASSIPIFSFNSSATASSSSSLSHTQPVFGSATPAIVASPGNHDQTNMEDSMAEDPVQVSNPSPIFGQPGVSPSQPGFMFGTAAPAPASPFQFGGQQNQASTAPASPFQFGGQQNQAATPNPSPFQASGSLDFAGGGSFSLGSGGGDKTGRKIVKVNRNRLRKK